MKNTMQKAFLLFLLLCTLLSLAACGERTGEPTHAPKESDTQGASVATLPPTDEPTVALTEAQTTAPTDAQTAAPTEVQTQAQTEAQTKAPTEAPTVTPTEAPTVAPTDAPTHASTDAPTDAPTDVPTEATTVAPTETVTEAPTAAPTEAPTDAPTLAPTDALTERQTEAPTAETEEGTLSPELEALLEANTPRNLLLPNSALMITVQRYDAVNLTEKYQYTYSRDAERAFSFDALKADRDGERLAVCNAFDGALYAWKKSGELFFGILPKESEDALFMLAVDLRSQTLLGEAVLQDGGLLLEASYVQDGVSFACTYRFDPESKRILGGERKAFDGESLLYSETITYQYASEADDFAGDRFAYTALTSPDLQAHALTVVEIGENGEREASRHYTFAADASTFLLSDGHAFYKNPMCTADVDDLSLYLAEYEGAATVYLTEKRADISFEYRLTDADFEKFKTDLAALEALVLSDEDPEAVLALFEAVGEQRLYLESQADAGHLFYCLNQHDTQAQEAYVHANKVHSDALILYHDFLETVYNSTSSAKSIVFHDWTEEKLQEFFGSEGHEQEIYDLQHANDQLTVTFYDIIGNGTPPWDEDAVAELYLQLVANNQSLALLHGYDHYYHYAAEEIYGRSYTAEEREIFREYVVTYIVPLLVHTYDRFDELFADLTLKKYLAYKDLLDSPYSDQSLTYLQGYIDSYGGELSENMKALFEKNAVLFGENEGAFAGAFVSYNHLYEEPYAYFGPGYQDILTLVHELGHYASLYTYSLDEMPYDLAETHSQGNEWMFLAYLEDQLDPQVAEIFVTYRLYSGLLSIVYAAMVDEFEDIVYRAQEAFSKEDLVALVATLADKYGGEEFLSAMSSYTPYQYVQYVSFSSPVYYLNYATSEIVSISLYLEAQEGYGQAQALYRALQGDADVTKGFVENIEAMGFLSPFEETLYEELCVLFGVTVAVP